jgi:hypothetical protein
MTIEFNEETHFSHVLQLTSFPKTGLTFLWAALLVLLKASWLEVTNGPGSSQKRNTIVFWV